MARLTPLLLSTVCAVAFSLVPASAAEAAGCGSIARQGETGVELVVTRGDGVGCGVVRRVLSDQRGAESSGWDCMSAGSEATCTHGSASASYTGTRFRSCGSVAFAPNSDLGAFGIVAKRVSCGKARRIAKASRPHGIGSKPYRFRAAGFRCTGVADPAATLPSVLYSCRRGAKAVGFSR